jgi:hypothetical protein
MKNLLNSHLTPIDKKAINFMFEKNLKCVQSKQKTYQLQEISFNDFVKNTNDKILELENLKKSDYDLTTKLLIELNINPKKDILKKLDAEKIENLKIVYIYKNKNLEQKIYFKN